MTTPISKKTPPKKHRSSRRRRGPLTRAGIPTLPESQHVGDEAALQAESRTGMPSRH